MRARDLMTCCTCCVDVTTPVSRINRAILYQNIGAVMVIADDGALVGIVTEGDLMRRRDSSYQDMMDQRRDLLAGGRPLNLELLYSLKLCESTAASVMTSPVIAVEEETNLADLVDLLLRNGIKRVPVMRNGKLAGIVGRRDILKALMGHES